MIRSYFRKDIPKRVSRYNYSINKFQSIDAFSSENSADLGVARGGYNIKVDNGKLTAGIGIDFPKYKGNLFSFSGIMTSAVKNMGYFRKTNSTTGAVEDRVVCYFANHKIGGCKLTESQFSEIELDDELHNVKFLNYVLDGEEVLLMIGDNEKMCVFDGEDATIYDCPVLNDVCVHKGRVFGINERENRLYFSTELDPTDWTIELNNGGYITFADEGGKVKKVMEFGGVLYIFREYAIHRLIVQGEQLDFDLTKIISRNNIIFPQTITCNNNTIIFLCSDGIFSFDGYKIKRIWDNIDALIQNKSYSSTCYFNDKLYLATNIFTTDEDIGLEEKNNNIKNNCIITIGSSGAIEIFRGEDVKEFLPINVNGENILLVNFNNVFNAYNIGMVSESGKLFGKILKSYWKSPYTNLEKLDYMKTLRRIYINAKGVIKLKAILDKEYDFNIFANGTTVMLPINKTADMLGIIIESEDPNFCVNSILLEFDMIKRGKNE